MPTFASINNLTMKHLKIIISLLFILLPQFGWAQGITYQTDPTTGAIARLGLNNDPNQMNWVLAPDGTQYPWVTAKHGWGLGYMTVNGQKLSWQKPVSIGDDKLVYRMGDITLTVTRQLSDGKLRETYAFRNTGKTDARITDWAIYTPWNDNYPDAHTCMTQRCDASVWAGDGAAYVCAVRMGDPGGDKHTGNVGLMVTRGELADYEVWERAMEKSHSNFRGVIAMTLPDMTLRGGHAYTVAWTLLEHGGRTDFMRQLLAEGGVVASSDRYVYELGDTVKVRLKANRLKTLGASIDGQPLAIARDANGLYALWKATSLGEKRIDLQYNKVGKTHASILVVSNIEQLMARRLNFILDHQQMNDSHDARYGAFMVYDNERHALYLNDDARRSSDTDEGRERVGMAVALAKWYKLHPDERIRQALIRHASFLRTQLQADDYTTFSRVGRQGENRGYNYAWVADFYFELYQLTGNRQYALDGYQTLQALYRHKGHGFYCIGIPVTTSLKALSDAGLQAEYNHLLIDYAKTADIFMKNGLNFPKHEVNFEQSIVAPATQFLLEMYLATRDSAYLKKAQEMLPVCENFCGQQPDYRLHEIAIRHWDGFWFGKRMMFGDTFPHYWSCINAQVYHYYVLATGDTTYQQRAEEIVRNNLCNLAEDGTATCAFVYPKRVNGEKAHFADPFANDQDWAVAYYLGIMRTR